ncbi:MAG: glycosyltransferase family 39 protein, partial [Candidatus Latescibacterota bacterium]
VWVLARVLAVLLSCGSLVLVWRLGRPWFGPQAALVGMLIVALSPGAIQQAHFYLIDNLFVLVVLAVAAASGQAVARHSRGWYLATGALVGAAGAVRLNGLGAGVILLVAHLGRGWTCGQIRGWRGAARSLADGNLWLSPGAAAGVLLGLQPYLLTAPERLTQMQTTNDLAVSLAIARLEVLAPWTLVDVHTVPLWDHWVRLMPWVVGWPLALLFPLAAVLGLRRLDPGRAALLAWCALHLLLVSSMPVKAVRYAVPLVPFLGLFTGWLAVRAWESRPRPLRLALRAVCLGLAAHLAASGLGLARIYTEEDPRIQAGRWIAAQVPPPMTVGLESGGYSLRGLVSQQGRTPFWLDTGGAFYTAPYALCATQAQALGEQLAAVDYLAVVPQNRAVQFASVPDLMPALASFYTELLAGRLGFAPVARFTVPPGIAGLRWSDAGAEPSFLGYDHPTVVVLRREPAPLPAQRHAEWGRLLAHDPRCCDGPLREAAALVSAGQTALALQRLAEVEAEFPFSKLAHRLRAEVHRGRGEEAAARAALERFVPARASGLTAYVSLGNARPHAPAEAARSFVELGLPDLAGTVLAEGLRDACIVPDQRPAASREYLRAAIALSTSGREDLAEAAVELACQIEETPVILNLLATRALQRGDRARAMALLERSLELDSRQPHAQETLARLASGHHP